MLKVSKERNSTKNRRGTRFDIRNDYAYNNNYYSDLSYDIDFNDTYDTSYNTYDSEPMYDVDFAYDDYVEESREKYVAPEFEPRYSSFREYEKKDGKIRSQKKKKGMSASVKALVVVYFAIVAVIAALLIVNALPIMVTTGASASIEGMENVEKVDIDSNSINNVTLPNGAVITLPVANTTPYEYTINTNWFDKMCDWMENIAA